METQNFPLGQVSCTGELPDLHQQNRPYCPSGRPRSIGLFLQRDINKLEFRGNNGLDVEPRGFQFSVPAALALPRTSLLPHFAEVT